MMASGAVVRLLVDRDADVSAQGGNALQATAQEDNEATVQLLIVLAADAVLCDGLSRRQSPAIHCTIGS
jgi:hypothetical protein